ncbi:MAG: prolipoprotein diacylglyceryl transferase [Anaerovoracaceae bacterium]|jgi:phosphatidylglycerol:prolipoprotein diacylglycerol transferase
MPVPDPIAFTIGTLEIRWYGIIIACAMVAAIVVLMKRAPLHAVKPEDVLDILIFSIPIGIVGARLYYVIFSWDYYSANPGEIIDIRAGGLAIHGGLIFGILTAFIVCRVKRLNFIDIIDMAAPAIALAQAIGRWGNYFNSEAHGGPTNLPWAITVMGEKVHPTFLYESIWCLILFFILIAIDNRRRFMGQVICLYGILYSAERICVEALRTDSLMIGPFRQAQVISIAIIVICAVAMVLLKRRSDRKSRR